MRPHRSRLRIRDRQCELDVGQLASEDPEPSVHGATVDDRGRYGLSALHYAVRGGKLPLIQLLLQRGARVNALDEYGLTPLLHLAKTRSKADPIPVMELLAASGANLDARDETQGTLLMYFARQGRAEPVKWLLAHGAKDELSPLERFISACARGDLRRAETMLEAHPNLRSELRTEHHLMLHVPAERGDAPVLETMLACGFDPNAKDNESITALHRAAMAGRSEAVRVLLAHGASVNALDGMFSATPLVWASEGWSHGPRAGVDHVGVAQHRFA